MRKGEFTEDEHILRAKIDMSSINMKLRDPLLYRIRHTHHFRIDVSEKYTIYTIRYLTL